MVIKITQKLINGDCITETKKLLNNMGGGKVDMILTDPPYLTNYSSNWRKDKNHRTHKPIINDNNYGLIKDAIPLLYDLLKDTGAMYMFCNSDHVDFFKYHIQQYFKFKNILIWIKNNHTAGDLKGSYGKKTEFIIFASKGRHLLRNGRDVDTLFYDRVSWQKSLHQNQKPVDLLEFLINKSTEPGDIVFDPFMGSGSTGVACKNTNRDFIGIELDEDYFDIAKERCEQ